MKTILVIEDNEHIRENACDMLELEGYKAIAAPNGKVGITLAKHSSPDIILCDIMMPEADGYEVLTALKNDGATTHIPFIFLTASVQRNEIEAGLRMGAKGYITKPFEAQDFFDTIARCLDLSQTESP